MDYCTLWFEGWWAHCCEAHDLGYALETGKALADDALFSCVVNSLPQLATENPALAGLASLASLIVGGTMWLGVRVFGGRFYKKPAQKDQ